jgi:serine/threonine protein kinase/formylglycine-generating enzyme required for sulfatase activity/energy-coupling factor transporter ATP-binding protein EcfA2
MNNFDPYDKTQDGPENSIPPSDSGDAEYPQRIGRYRIEKVLGKGGFGIVYLAHDEQLNRRVAVKVPHAKLISKPEDAEAYLAEARTVANLDHPGIVPVHDVGSMENCPCYIVSKYIPGTDLATKIKQHRLKYREATEIVATVAESLHYAHKQGLVHRDVKPGNILIGKDDKPYVVDFGLALREENIGKGPKYAGTPAYMSPEQARGEGHRVDGRSDVFSLGIVFYELLAGRQPFRGDTRAELFEQLTSYEARPLRQYDEKLPKELERICNKAMAKRANDRYSSAHDLAEDLRHFLADQTLIQSGASPGGITSDASVTPASRSASTTPASRSASTSVGSVAASSASLGAGSYDSQPIKIVPKGLRSFDAHDADFFLELLPGPRDREGLPDSLRFWKTRIEETDPDNTFKVGLIYGPSGCGKSSLVKAGLLPRLSEEVIAVYIEATPEETETRLLHGLRKRCPALEDNLTLTETLAELRRGQGIPVGKKVLIVLDQFEQWLHAKKKEENTELVKALRQCDGGRVQCIVMVRDDFWMAATRFMRELEVRLVEAQNSAAVDLFPILHAEKVLTAFGRAFGTLPENVNEVNKEQKSFLTQSVAGLAEEGKVICVRLALFAEMMKGKPWTPTTLMEVGGTKGVGVTFLEETFSASNSPPEHRYHQNAARAVLKDLLPDSGTDIKGYMRSHAELLEASGYGSRPKDFDDLVRILDSEIRLITPTDPEGKDTGDDSVTQSQAGQKYFQLTHDYLVHSLREWLTRKQKETRKGRAELKLFDTSVTWNAKPETRFLPSLVDWLSIRTLTDKKQWTEPQRRLMRAAGRVHGLWATGISLVLIVCVISAIGIRRSVLAEQNQTNAKRLVEALVKADTAKVPDLVKQLRDYRKWADPLLTESLSSAAEDSTEKLHLSLALLDQDQRQVDYLYQQLIRTDSQRFPIIRDALAKHHETLLERLWNVVTGREQDLKQERLHAAAALAQYDPKSPSWNYVSAEVVNQLATVSPVFLRDWMTALRPVREKLLSPLGVIYRDAKRRESERSLVTEVLADFASDQPDVLAELVKDADETQFAVVFSRLQKHGKATIPLLESELQRTLTPDWQDPPLSNEWRDVEPLLVKQIETAKGMVAERFAFCQSMPLDQFPAICEALRPSGYRPTRVRPYSSSLAPSAAGAAASLSNSADGTGRMPATFVSAIWTRDNLRWQLQPSVAIDRLPEPDSPAIQDGLLLQDVASLPSADAKSEPRFIAVWCEPTTPQEGPQEERRAVIDVSQAELATAQTQFQDQNIVSQTALSVRTDVVGERRYTALYSNLGPPTQLREAYSGLALGDELQWDIAVSSAGKLADPLDSFRQQLALCKNLPPEKRNDPKILESQAIAHYQLGNLDVALGDLDFLISKGVSTPEILQYRTLTLARLGKSDEAKESLAKYLEINLPASFQAYVRILVPAWLGEAAQASTELESSVTSLGANSDNLYNLACAAALCSQAFATKVPASSQRFADRAIELLQQIVAQGYNQVDQLKSDADFANLHADPRFLSLLKKLEPSAKYATVLSSNTKWESKLLATVPLDSLARQLTPLLSQGWRPFSIAIDSNSPITERDEYNRTCSLLLHRPVIPDDSRLSLAKRQAGSAIALLRQGEREKIFSALRVSDDPESLTQFVHRCRARSVSFGELWDCVQIVERTRPALRGDSRRLEDRVLFGLLMALGEFSLSEIPLDQRDSTVNQLATWYRDDPSSTIHGASGWLLRHWQQTDVAGKVDETPLAYSPQREWFTLAIPGGNQMFFQTYVVIQPGNYEIGSPRNEPGRFANETRHTVQISRPFALLDREVTRAEYEASAVARNDFVVQYSPTIQHPIAAANWYDCVRYCRWLTEQAGFAEDDQCYADPKSLDRKVFATDPNPAAVGAPLNWPLRAEKRGFRLPTEAEWEIASRSGTWTRYGFGQDVSLLERYAWFKESSARQAHLPRTLRPNLAGLFDLNGNVSEWCHDWVGIYGSTSDPLGPATGSYRAFRGGSWNGEAVNCRTAGRGTNEPTAQIGNVGLRLALTPSMPH